MQLARVGALLSLVCGACALLLVVLSAAAFGAVGWLFDLFGVHSDLWTTLNAYPLGAIGAIAVYVLGMALGFFALRQPKLPSFGMLLVGIVAVSLGGPIAKVYGIILIAAGVLCMLGAQRLAK